VRPLAALVVLGLALAAAAPAPATEWAAAPPSYETALAPHGSWVEVDPWGSVWRPAVVADWRPYLYGHWVWSPYGWTWVSSEPWAWTFHYGRWAFAPVYGWVWVPGSTWGPAWVDWYWGDGLVGWAPLGPPGVHVGFGSHVVFVRERDFCERRLGGFVVDHRRLPPHVRHDWGARGMHPPPRDDVARVGRRPVTRIAGRPPGSEAPRGRRPAARLAPPRTTPRLHGSRLAEPERTRRADSGRPRVSRGVERDARPGVVRAVPRLGSPRMAPRPSRPWVAPAPGRPELARTWSGPGRDRARGSRAPSLVVPASPATASGGLRPRPPAALRGGERAVGRSASYRAQAR
jgi:hypothetical protein